MRKLRALGCGMALLGTLLFANVPKRLVRNVMSHHPVHYGVEQTLKELPALLFTRGSYTGQQPFGQCKEPASFDLNAIYLGLEKNPFHKSAYVPVSLTRDANVTFYSPGCNFTPQLSQESIRAMDRPTLKRIIELTQGGAVRLEQNRYHNLQVFASGAVRDFSDSRIGFGNYTLSVGRDARGRYLSFYDIWDFGGKGGYYSGHGGYFTDRKDTTTLDEIGAAVVTLFGTPIHFYDRYYFEDLGITDKVLQDSYLQAEEF